MVQRRFPVLFVLSLPWLWGSCSSTSSTSAAMCSGDDAALRTGDNGCVGTRTCVQGTWSTCDCDPGADNLTSAASSTGSPTSSTTAGATSMGTMTANATVTATSANATTATMTTGSSAGSMG